MRTARPTLALARHPLETRARRRTQRVRSIETRAEDDDDDRVERRVQVCASKECARRGARRTLARLRARAETLEGASRVVVETTTCLSECGSGPNVEVLPEGVVLNGVRSDEDAAAALRRAAE